MLKPKKIFISGATSAIAHKAARRWTSGGDVSFCLMGRSEDRLVQIASDLKAFGAKSVEILVSTYDSALLCQEFEKAWSDFDGFDLCLLAHGALGDQNHQEIDFAMAKSNIETNFLTYVALLTPMANRMAERMQGSIVVISSVAGDRGRQSNYVYGSAKAGLSAFAAGLRNRLAAYGVQVLTVKPGFVDTPMTAHLPKNALFASPDEIAQGIYLAVQKNRNTVYLPWFWLGIMTIIRLIPEAIFKKLKL